MLHVLLFDRTKINHVAGSIAPPLRFVFSKSMISFSWVCRNYETLCTETSSFEKVI